MPIGLKADKESGSSGRVMAVLDFDKFPMDNDHAESRVGRIKGPMITEVAPWSTPLHVKVGVAVLEPVIRDETAQ